MPDKSIAERLQVKGDRRLAVVGASPALDGLIGARDVRADAAEADVVLVFTANRAAFDAQLPSVLQTAHPTAILWVAYPKLTSNLAGDLNRDIVRVAAAAHGLDTVSQIAIDEDWSAMRLKRLA